MSRIARAAAIWIPAVAVALVAAASGWVHGNGLVDPVSYSYDLPHLLPPVPSLARPPIVSLLFAVPLRSAPI
ncbi:MAG TPA: hypothetical protein VKM54_06185 [Myxococcota bacterium]|nr:hypothetical protein [Myxococcota bacterium]